MSSEKALVNQVYLLEKFPGKGGWTFARLPEILPDKNAPFGWVSVFGTIDNIAIKGYHLMPMGNGQLFLPIKAAIRKQLGKSSGDKVHVILYRDNLPTEIPEELMQCFQDEPGSYEAFKNLTESEKKANIENIYTAKSQITKANRILALMKRLGPHGEK